MWRRLNKILSLEALDLHLTEDSGFDYITAISLFIQSG